MFISFLLRSLLFFFCNDSYCLLFYHLHVFNNTIAEPGKDGHSFDVGVSVKFLQGDVMSKWGRQTV